jgi:hypothetical protein
MTTELTPTEIPPRDLGTTIALDEIVGRSDMAAVVLRTITIYSRLARVNIEVFASPDVNLDNWTPMLLKATPIPASSSRVKLSWEYGDDTRGYLQAWGGSGGDRYFSATYWSQLQDTRLPKAVCVEWPEVVTGRMPLPEARIAAAVAKTSLNW